MMWRRSRSLARRTKLTPQEMYAQLMEISDHIFYGTADQGDSESLKFIAAELVKNETLPKSPYLIDILRDEKK